MATGPAYSNYFPTIFMSDSHCSMLNCVLVFEVTKRLWLFMGFKELINPLIFIPECNYMLYVQKVLTHNI